MRSSLYRNKLRTAFLKSVVETRRVEAVSKSLSSFEFFWTENSRGAQKHAQGRFDQIHFSASVDLVEFCICIPIYAFIFTSLPVRCAGQSIERQSSSHCCSLSYFLSLSHSCGHAKLGHPRIPFFFFTFVIAIPELVYINGCPQHFCILFVFQRSPSLSLMFLGLLLRVTCNPFSLAAHVPSVSSASSVSISVFSSQSVCLRSSLSFFLVFWWTMGFRLSLPFAVLLYCGLLLLGGAVYVCLCRSGRQAVSYLGRGTA